MVSCVLTIVSIADSTGVSSEVAMMVVSTVVATEVSTAGDVIPVFTGEIAVTTVDVGVLCMSASARTAPP